MYDKKNKLLVLKTAFFCFFICTNVNAAITCKSFLRQEIPLKSLEYYSAQLSKEISISKAIEPKFLDPVKEIKLTKKWRGIITGVPKSVRSVLHKGARILDYQVLTADKDAVVRASAGKFTSFRFIHEWRGKDMSTNIGLPISSIFLKALEKKNEGKLVPENAEAVFIFMHGGGTKTTGHQVAANITNYLEQFGVVVLSIDAPFHAYGPRVQDLSPKEYYEYLRDFRHKYIPARVDTFIGGHSMGGLHADNIMRMSDNKELKMAEAFKGLINLSGPMDSAPGKSVGEKEKAAKEISSNKELMKLVPAEERDLMTTLLLQGKSSALSSLSAETFSIGVNWVKPLHNGKDYIPTLVIMGERDALYVGQEKIFDEHLTALQNTETHILGQRKSLKEERDIWVSHMIFDHKRPKSQVDTGETFLLIKEFIETTLGKKLNSEVPFVVASKGKQNQNATGAQAGQIVSQFIQTYIGNLAFRKFAQQYVITEKKASSLLNDMNKESQEKYKTLSLLRRELKMLKKSDSKSEKITELEKTINAQDAEVKILKSKIQSNYIPENAADNAFAKINIEERERLRKKIFENNGNKKALKGKLRALQEQVKDLKIKSERVLAEVLHRENHKNRELVLAKDAIRLSLNRLLKLQIQMNKRNSEIVRANHEKGISKINPPADLIKIYEELNQAYAEYNQEVTKGKEIVKKLILEGEFGDDFLAIYTKLHGVGPEKGLLNGIHELRVELVEIEKNHADLSKKTSDLLVAYIHRITPELYTIIKTTGEKELDRPINELLKDTSGLQSIWAVWLHIWRDRPAEQGVSLY